MPCITKNLESLEMLGDGGMRGSGKTTLCSVLQKVGAPDPLKPELMGKLHWLKTWYTLLV